MTQADSLYQQLRGHLAYLKLGAAAEALPAALDQATKEKLNHTEFLQRLLAIEVDATYDDLPTVIDRVRSLVAGRRR